MAMEQGANGNFNQQSEPSLDLTAHALAANQRLLSLAFGSGLLLGASSRRSLPLALTGALLVYRGATGRWAFSGWLPRLGVRRRSRTVSVPHGTGIKIERSVIIQKSPEELYRFWRDVENLPRFMSQVVSVERNSNLRSHWKVKSLVGTTFEWDAEIINDIANELIAWRSVEGSGLDHAGSVHFKNVGNGATRVTVVMEYRPPAGKIGAEVARLFGAEPSQILEKDLQRLKQLCESGESPTIRGQPQG